MFRGQLPAHHDQRPRGGGERDGPAARQLNLQPLPALHSRVHRVNGTTFRPLSLPFTAPVPNRVNKPPFDLCHCLCFA